MEGYRKVKPDTTIPLFGSNILFYYERETHMEHNNKRKHSNNKEVYTDDQRA